MIQSFSIDRSAVWTMHRDTGMAFASKSKVYRRLFTKKVLNI